MLWCLFLAVILVLAAPQRAISQAPTPVGIEVIEIWVKARSSAQRAWDRDIERRGISFAMDATTETRLRALGATDEWVAMLRRAQYHAPPAPPIPTPEEAPAAAAAPAPSHRFTREDLRPVYFGRTMRMLVYAGVWQVNETGGAVAPHTYMTSVGSLEVESTPLTQPVAIYGISMQRGSADLDIEMFFQGKHFKAFLAGVGLAPFLPIGSTGLRVILGATPMAGFTTQVVGHLSPSQVSSDNRTEVQIANVVIGGAARAGLAYHWRPGSWLFAEWNYRILETVSRTLDIPGREPIKEDFPWSKWGANGSMLRLGIGF